MTQDTVPKDRQSTTRKRCVFFYAGPKNAEVELAGDFNGWRPEKMRYRQEKEGFVLNRFLPPGEYQYKLIVNGEWQADPANSEFIYNLHGTINSLVRVSP